MRSLVGSRTPERRTMPSCNTAESSRQTDLTGRRGTDDDEDGRCARATGVANEVLGTNYYTSPCRRRGASCQGRINRTI